MHAGNLEPRFMDAYYRLMAKRFTIGELAKAVGVPSSTLRYYERIRLLQPEGRSSGNYRLYGEGSLERVRFIRAAQSTGFELQDVAALLELRDGVAEPCRDVQTLIEERLAKLDERMREMRRVKKVLASSLELCQAAKKHGGCEVIEKLNRKKARKDR